MNSFWKTGFYFFTYRKNFMLSYHPNIDNKIKKCYHYCKKCNHFLMEVIYDITEVDATLKNLNNDIHSVSKDEQYEH